MLGRGFPLGFRSLLFLHRALELLPLKSVISVEYASGDQCQQCKALGVDTRPEHAVCLVMVTSPNGLGRLVERVGGGRAPDWDQWFFFQPPP